MKRENITYTNIVIHPVNMFFNKYAKYLYECIIFKYKVISIPIEFCVVLLDLIIRAKIKKGF